MFLRQEGLPLILFVGDLTYYVDLLPIRGIPGIDNRQQLLGSTRTVNQLKQRDPDLAIAAAHDPGAAKALHDALRSSKKTMRTAELLRYLIVAPQRAGNRQLSLARRSLSLKSSQAKTIRVLGEFGPLSLRNFGNLLICESGSNPSRLIHPEQRGRGLVGLDGLAPLTHSRVISAEPLFASKGVICLGRKCPSPASSQLS
jgi:hypothetical protein